MEKKNYDWFGKRRITKGLDMAYRQISSAVGTVAFLYQAAKNFSEGKEAEAKQSIEDLFKAEEEVDELRAIAFKELSKGVALIADYREDLLHLIKRLDTIADHTKDAGRCLKILIEESKLPSEFMEKTSVIIATLVDCAEALRESIENISVDPTLAIRSAKRVEDIEHEIDKDYLETKALFLKYGDQINCGSMVIFDDLIEFLEQAADLCADTADYIKTLASRE